MTPGILLAVVLGYFALLLAVARVTSRRAGNDAFFIGNRRSNWMLVAFGMIGTSLSGVTFVSVPGAVGRDGFSYLQIVVGHMAGFAGIAFVLLPLYYRERLTSIYHFLDSRLGPWSCRTGAWFFILSRTLGATARLYLVVRILQDVVLDGFQVPFWVTALAVLAMILLYTYEGGVKTIVWTDTLQTACMLFGLVVCIVYVLGALRLSVPQSLALLHDQGLSQIIVTDGASARHWLKQFVAGAFIALAMIGMDQEMMQKTISVRTLADSQKNVMTLAVIMLGAVMLFLYLGGLLYLYAPTVGVSAVGDRIFPAIVLGHLPPAVQLIFLIALVSALFPSADGAITALTSSFCIDILRLREREDLSDARAKAIRQRVHLGFAGVFVLLVLAFRVADNPSMINVILKLAGYTYGPLLGLFAFGILTRRPVRDRWVPAIALAAPLLCLALDLNQQALFGDYRFGLELLVVNGLLTFGGLWLAVPALRRRTAH